MVLWSVKVLLPFSNILTTRITVARSPHPLCDPSLRQRIFSNPLCEKMHILPDWSFWAIFGNMTQLHFSDLVRKQKVIFSMKELLFIY